MDTCVRGFSYMPESKIDANLQFIESGELERTWKLSRRQRVKNQEQRIWEDFVKEQDMVQKAYSEDPYQFLHELPENALKELMESELIKLKKETEEVIVEQPNQGEGDHPCEKQAIVAVTFAEDSNNDVDMFHIFDDDTELNPSGGEEDPPESPSTVRERHSDSPPGSQPDADLPPNNEGGEEDPPESPSTVRERHSDSPPGSQPDADLPPNNEGSDISGGEEDPPESPSTVRERHSDSSPGSQPDADLPPNNEGSDISGGEEDPPESPSTVRERHSDSSPGSQPDADLPPNNEVTASVKSSENVSNVIESSIYCARVRDLRLKISEEMSDIMLSLDAQDISSLEGAEVSQRCRRAASFCGRFARVYMYQLQRQVETIKRHVSKSPPFAQHTNFQAQMFRIVSLHQNMLQALQVFHKSFAATSCLRESGRALTGVCAFIRDVSDACRSVPAPKDFVAARDLYNDVFHKSFAATSCLRESGRALTGVCAFIRDVSDACRSVPAPKDFVAARDLYNDELVLTCDKLESAVQSYSQRVADFVSSTEMLTLDVNGASSSTKIKKLKKPLPNTKTLAKILSTKDTDARLSMYSLDTLRNNQAKTSRSRDASSGTSKGRASPRDGAGSKSPNKAKTNKKTCRRPLMRAPESASRGSTARRQDADIATMVQRVRTCESSHTMGAWLGSPSQSPRQNTPRRPPAHPPTHPLPRSPRKYSPALRSSPLHSARNSQKTTAWTKNSTGSPKGPGSRRNSPKPSPTRNSPITDRSETPNSITTIKTVITPVTKIQCAKKSPRKADNSSENLKGTGRSKYTAKHSDQSVKNSDRSVKLLHVPGRDKDNEITGPPKGAEYGKRIAKNGDDTDGKKGIIDKDLVTNKSERPGHIGNPGKEDNTGKEFCGVKELTDNNDDYSVRYAREVEEEKCEREKNMNKPCDVTRLLRQLCSGDPAGLTNEKVTGAKNAQLLCIRGVSPPRQPSTPQLLRILEETIQKQSPRPLYVKPRNPERYRLNFNIPETTANRIFQYRTRFVQHMLTSPLYANSAVGKPWEMIGSVSDKIIDELLQVISKEMEVSPVLRELYNCETN